MSGRTPGPWAREFRVRAQAAQDGMPQTFAVSFLRPNGEFVDVGYADTRAEAVAMRDQYQLDEVALYTTRVAPSSTVCHCGLGIEDHEFPGAAEHEYVPNPCARNAHDSLVTENARLREALTEIDRLATPHSEGITLVGRIHSVARAALGLPATNAPTCSKCRTSIRTGVETTYGLMCRACMGIV